MVLLSGATDPYRLIDELYDAEHDGFDEDIELLLAVTEDLDGPILELGCGSGRVMLPLAEAGHQVTGVDVSPVMLERARGRVKAVNPKLSIQLAEMDMRSTDPDLGSSFAMAVYSLNGFMHLTAQDDQLRSLQAVHRSLAPSGMVFLDLMNPVPEYLERIAGHTSLDWSGVLGDGRQVLKWSHREVDIHEQTIDTSIWYDLTGNDGQVSRVHTKFVVRYVHLSELDLMLQLAGFGSPTAYGSYELDPLHAQSERLIVTAEKV
ncbi:MAG TPA: class I SAM-dependent methyltransferase [Thermomicrobiales bacterium]|nr:class I SAM-dependent methyltransferase [Thermomicrobiales bacterium]